MNTIGENGYRLWLRYRITDGRRLSHYRMLIGSATIFSRGATYDVVKSELDRALPDLLGKRLKIGRMRPSGNALIIGTVAELQEIEVEISRQNICAIGDGYLIRSFSKEGHRWTIITANTDGGVVNGVFRFLRLLQTLQDIRRLDICSRPRIRRRILSHWDNLDGTVERGYAGRSLWKWEQLPDRLDRRYRDYARACASIGINGTVLNNVNARAESLETGYLVKTAALANVLRPYGIQVYLSATFNAPERLGGLATSDPRNPDVLRWWKKKVDEIYELIPDFGGFQVKAGSEGQPGPQEYGANQQDGANMLADALQAHGGIVLWRAFVYDATIDQDRAKCAYKEFSPLDGKFKPGAFVQVKNGPIDFQPREPFHPLFGAMPKTRLALELQITQEYLGRAVHLVYLAPMWQEILRSDTYARGQDSTIAKIVDGSMDGNDDSAIVGVANTGLEKNWCGHHFAQANWYAFGRLAWDHQLDSEDICDEWIRMTWSNDPKVVESIKKMMLGSWEACVNYMTPLGLHHIMKEGHHYGPDPGFSGAKREDWNSVYYHKADTTGLGFDRSSKGSDSVAQYAGPLREKYDRMESCPEKYLLWFHHVPWNYRLKSGNELFDELKHRYNSGCEFASRMLDEWRKSSREIDPRRYEHVRKRLRKQKNNAQLWRAVCTNYFGRFAQRK